MVHVSKCSGTVGFSASRTVEAGYVLIETLSKGNKDACGRPTMMINFRPYAVSYISSKS